MDIIPKLNLNKHPKDCDNNSLVYAKNIRLNNNGINLTIDEQLKNIDNIPWDNSVNEIVGVISCNKELVLFVTTTISNYINIYRYDEDSKEMKLSCINIEYNGGEIIGTFTYNVNNELIIAYSEYGENLNIPIKTLNLKEFGFGKIIDINNELLPLIPEVNIPSITNEIIIGTAYKGWYYIFIRYKHNNEYTQWYNTNSSIFIDSYSTELISSYLLSKQQIEVYGASEVTKDGASGYDNVIEEGNSYLFDTFKTISRKEDIVNTSFKCNISNIDQLYDYYQLGFINVTKTNSKAFKSFDIKKEQISFTFDSSLIENYNINDLIDTYNNYYNVKNIINYNNRLYIGNYKENDINSNLENELPTLGYNLFQVTEEYKNDVEIIDSLYLIASYNNKKIYNNIKCEQENDDYKFSILDYVAYNESYQNNVAPVDESIEIKPIYPQVGFIRDLIKYVTKNIEEYVIQINDATIDDISSIIFKTNNTIIDSEDNVIATLNANTETKIKLHKVISTIDDLIPDDDLEEIEPTLIAEYKIPPIETQIFANTTSIYISYSFNKIKINDNTRAILNSCGILPYEYYNFYIHFIDKYGQITNGYNLNKLTNKNNENEGLHFINNGSKYDGLFKIESAYPKFNDSDANNPKMNLTTLYKNTLNFNLHNLPKGYVGYFISYEKLEKEIILKGVAGFNIEYNITDDGGTGSPKLIIIKFYTSELITNDKININANKLRIYKTTNHRDASDFDNEFIINTKYKFEENELSKIRRDFILNRAKYGNNFIIKDFDIEDSFLEVNQNGVYIRLKLNENNISNINDITSSFYIAQLINDEKELYKNNNKKLIPASNIVYGKGIANVNTKNGFNTIINALFFKSHIFDSATAIFKPDGNIGAEDGNIISLNYADYLELPQESFIINNEPIVYFSPVQGLHNVDENKKSFIKSKILEGKNYVDLYKQPNVVYSDLYPKALTNFKENINNIEIFNKTLRRSNVIQSESLENAWRKFNLEEYKIITENKGNITNIVGIGYYLFVHTEHSLFAFNTDNIMKTENKDIQLATPDVFDLTYKEIFTSQFGYAGLQDSKSFIVDTFGYIYYDNDSNRFYQFDNNQLNLIDEDIVNWLMYWKPTNVRFVNDSDNNRILINLTLKDNTNTTLSYNYLSKSFISFHDINFSKGINTKNNLYILDENKILKTINKNKYVTESFVNIIINAEYETIKFLESIVYKLYKNNNNVAFDNIPVEGQLYSGDTLRIYNNSVDTKEQSISSEYNGAIEINKFNNYKLPYYYLGNWHFNYLRDNSREDNTDIDKRSRLYGNYFKLLFKFTTNEEVPFEFESLNYIIKNK